ncbi:MAG: ImmA/IrrE family metallo-endopeptidase [Blastocatellia bacterium]|nr:ImmA/IrrE family metallo-endopeptidase [Blastocatellia bacterium]
MAGGETIPVNPALVEWARRESGYDRERVARRLQVKEERFAAWETGDRQPTFRQVQQLAAFFRRPLSVFFLPRPPQLAPLAAEYRRLPGLQPGHESPELRLALRQMLGRRENALNLMGELGESVPKFSLLAHLRESPAEVGVRMREATGIDPLAQLDWTDEWRAWAAWRTAIEGLGVLVFQFPKVALEEVRGLALLRMPLPVIAINGKEIVGAKGYTVFHELAHLMLAAGNEEKPALREDRSATEWEKVERFAEIAASHALVPDATLSTVVGNLGLRNAAWDIQDVRKLAKAFRITPLAMATRLRESDYMSWTRYNQWRADWEAYVSTLPKRRGGFASPVEKAVSRAGRPFTQLVLEALSSNRLTAVDAARYLDLRFEHFENLRAHVSRGPSEGTSDE